MTKRRRCGPRGLRTPDRFTTHPRFTRACTSASTKPANVGGMHAVFEHRSGKPGHVIRDIQRRTPVFMKNDGPRYSLLSKSWRPTPSGRSKTSVSLRRGGLGGLYRARNPHVAGRGPARIGSHSPLHVPHRGIPRHASQQPLHGVAGHVRHRRSYSRGCRPSSRARPLTFVRVQRRRGEKDGPHLCVTGDLRTWNQKSAATYGAAREAGMGRCPLTTTRDTGPNATVDHGTKGPRGMRVHGNEINEMIGSTRGGCSGPDPTVDNITMSPRGMRAHSNEIIGSTRGRE